MPTLRRRESASARGGSVAPTEPGIYGQSPAPPLSASLLHPDPVWWRKVTPGPTERAFRVATAHRRWQAYDVSVQRRDFSCGLPATSALASAVRVHAATARPGAGGWG